MRICEISQERKACSAFHFLFSRRAPAIGCKNMNAAIVSFLHALKSVCSLFSQTCIGCCCTKITIRATLLLPPSHFITPARTAEHFDSLSLQTVIACSAPSPCSLDFAGCTLLNAMLAFPCFECCSPNLFSSTPGQFQGTKPFPMRGRVRRKVVSLPGRSRTAGASPHLLGLLNTNKRPL